MKSPTNPTTPTVPATMRAIAQRRYGSSEVLQLVSNPTTHRSPE